MGNNTYGGSVADKPALGDGTIVGTSSEDMAKARLFDLNFLRYASVEPRPNLAEGELCWSEGNAVIKIFDYHHANTPQNKKQKDLVLRSLEKLCETNFPIDAREWNPKAITTIIYMDPTADLPIFNGMAGGK